MNPLRLIRTSTFQLAWWYMGIFGASALVLIGVVWWVTVGYLEDQTDTILNEEVQGLVTEYGQRGLPGLARVIRQRMSSNVGPSTFYLLVDRDGTPLVGNLPSWPPELPDSDGWYNLLRIDAAGRRTRIRGRAVALQDDRRLLVAQDQGHLDATRNLINKTFRWALGGGLALALLGGILMSYSVMRRIEAINRASREIMAGRLQRRMPVRGVNDEFDQLSGNLNAMLDRIDSLMEEVRSVADNIAHDLRTPLTRLRGRLEMLAARPGLADDLREDLGAAMSDADHLLATFRALLRIARIESGTHEQAWSDVDLRTLLGDAWELYQAVGEERDIPVQFGGGSGTVRGDRDLLFQALCNLLDNAIKYSAPGTVVVLEAHRSDDGQVGITVADRGPGIPPEERDKVLNRFYRCAGVTGTPGSGLGLALVNAIAHHHGGTVELSDNKPGLRVTLRLPLRPEAALDKAGGLAPAGAIG